MTTLSTPVASQEPPPPRPEQLQDGNATPNADAGAGAEQELSEQAPLTNGLAGPFLAARMATVQSDFRAAAKYFSQAVASDPTDLYLQDGALLALISSGDVERATALSQKIADQGGGTELSELVRRVELARQGDWAELVRVLDERAAESDSESSSLLDGMMRAWALLGSGNASAAMQAFEKLSEAQDVAPMVNYHLSLARAMVGDYEGANELLSESGVAENLLGVIVRVQVLAQLERRDEAIALLDNVQGIETEPELVELKKRLEAGEEVLFDLAQTPADGIAQMLMTFATALAENPDPEPLSLVHGRLASRLAPDFAAARILVAQLLQSRGQFDLAEQEFAELRKSGELRPLAELSRIDALSQADRLDEAESAALALTAAHPELPQAWIALGDLLRQDMKFSQAVPAYDKALSLLKDKPTEARWFTLYASGIALERAGEFERAEDDLLAAIEIQPEEPSLLNYLGYSWIDRNKNLERGLELIRRAVALSPDDGYILDSLAWAYYRLGRYDEALEPMEKAVASMSSDPVVNDHLGDIYWKVGREREAEIQWQRALSFEPTESGEIDPERIRAKLERGLDAVLQEEESAGNNDQLPAPKAEASAGQASPD